MVNVVTIPFKMEATEAIKSFTWYGNFAISPVEIPLKRQATLHHALACIFITDLRNCWCALPEDAW
jgi:hypothetical protein